MVTKLALILCMGASLIVGCSSTSSVPATSSPSTAVTEPIQVTKAKAQEGMEVLEGTPCAPRAVDAILGKHVQVGAAHGTLALRKANPNDCLDYFWAKFYPDITPGQENAAGFTVFVVVGDKDQPDHDKYFQASDQGNPRSEAWTKGTYVPPGGRVYACLESPGAERQCLDMMTVT